MTSPASRPLWGILATLPKRSSPSNTRLSSLTNQTSTDQPVNIRPPSAKRLSLRARLGRDRIKRRAASRATHPHISCSSAKGGVVHVATLLPSARPHDRSRHPGLINQELGYRAGRLSVGTIPVRAVRVTSTSTATPADPQPRVLGVAVAVQVVLFRSGRTDSWPTARHTRARRVQGLRRVVQRRWLAPHLMRSRTRRWRRRCLVRSCCLRQ